jgi:hypothetical protein
VAGGQADVPVGDDAQKLSVLDHGKVADALFQEEVVGLLEGRLRSHAEDRALHHVLDQHENSIGPRGRPKSLGLEALNP